MNNTLTKLEELHKNGLAIAIGNNSLGLPKRHWKAQAHKVEKGVYLAISAECDSVEEAIDELYNKWIDATSHGLKEHRLNQIEHQKREEPPQRPNPRFVGGGDDEIPF